MRKIRFFLASLLVFSFLGTGLADMASGEISIVEPEPIIIEPAVITRPPVRTPSVATPTKPDYSQALGNFYLAIFRLNRDFKNLRQNVEGETSSFFDSFYKELKFDIAYMPEEKEEKSFWQKFIAVESYDRENFGYSDPILRERAVAGPQEVSSEPEVIASNFLLAIIFFLLVGISSSIFNNILDNHKQKVDQFFAKYFSWFSYSGAIERAAYGRHIFLLSTVILLYALIGAHISPDFNLFKGKNLGMLLVLVPSVIIGSYAKDFMRYVVTKVWKAKSYFRPYFFGLIFAVVCVLSSRLLNIEPGYIFGIPMGIVIVSRKAQQKEGLLEFFGIFWVVVASFITLMLTLLFIDYEVISDFLDLLFVILIEAAFFELFPISYLAGGSIFAWNKVAWGILFTLSSFFMLHTLFNPDSTLGPAIAGQKPTLITVIFLGLYSVAAITMWSYLLIKKK